MSRQFWTGDKNRWTDGDIYMSRNRKCPNVFRIERWPSSGWGSEDRWTDVDKWMGGLMDAWVPIHHCAVSLRSRQHTHTHTQYTVYMLYFKVRFWQSPLPIHRNSLTFVFFYSVKLAASPEVACFLPNSSVHVLFLHSWRHFKARSGKWDWLLQTIGLFKLALSKKSCCFLCWLLCDFSKFLPKCIRSNKPGLLDLFQLSRVWEKIQKKK